MVPDTTTNTSSRWLRILFHILFWTYWLGTPFITAENEQQFDKMVAMLPVMLTNIPLFFLNTEWLLPRLLPKHGLSRYFTAVMLLAIAFILLQIYIRINFVDCVPQLETRHQMRVVFAVFFVTAVSTGYVWPIISLEKNTPMSRNAQNGFARR